MADVDVSIFDEINAEDVIRYRVNVDFNPSLYDEVSTAEEIGSNVVLTVSKVDTVSAGESLGLGWESFPSVYDAVSVDEYVNRLIPYEVSAEYISASLAGDLQYSNVFIPKRHGRDSGYFNLVLSGTWAGTITLQCSFDYCVSWVTVATYTSNTKTALFEPESGVFYRIGIVTAGDYTSGTAVVRMSRGN